MAQYIVKGNRVEVVPDGSLIIKQNLPAGTYFVKYEQSSSYEGFYLESSPNFSTPTSIYGDIMERTDRIVNTYLDRAKQFVNTGVLLSGIKGSGKTFQAKIISNVLREKYNIPTLIVSATYNPTKLALYLKDITDPAYILFEEFEKFYKVLSKNERAHGSDTPVDMQDGLLTLLDGVINSNKLFVFTCNTLRDINDLLLNRPGRVWYHFAYNGISDSIVQDYCNENLDDENEKVAVQQICNYLDDAFTFDMLQAVVEETKRQKKNPFDIINHMNIVPNPYSTEYEIESITSKEGDKVEPVYTSKYITIDNYLDPEEVNSVRIKMFIRTKKDIERVKKIIEAEDPSVTQQEMMLSSDVLEDGFSEKPIGFKGVSGMDDSGGKYFIVRVALTKKSLVSCSRGQLVYEKHGIKFVLNKVKKSDVWKTFRGYSYNI